MIPKYLTHFFKFLLIFLFFLIHKIWLPWLMLVCHILIIGIGHLMIRRILPNLPSGSREIILECCFIPMLLSLNLQTRICNAPDQILHLCDLLLILVLVVLNCCPNFGKQRLKAPVQNFHCLKQLILLINYRWKAIHIRILFWQYFSLLIRQFQKTV